MHACWVSFAKTGKPGCAVDGTVWPQYAPARDELMQFDSPPKIVAHYRKAQLDAQTAAQAR
jgi:para-nitrobenzyl esterase